MAELDRILELLPIETPITAQLIELPRILRGALTVGSKVQLARVLRPLLVFPEFNENVTLFVRNIRNCVRDIQATQNNDEGGYIRIERDFEVILNELGKLHSYLFERQQSLMLQGQLELLQQQFRALQLQAAR